MTGKPQKWLWLVWGILAAGCSGERAAGPGPPAIFSLAPTRGFVGTRVTIRGINLAQTREVRFQGAAAGLELRTDTTLVVRVPPGAQDGPLTVKTSEGEATSREAFDVLSDLQLVTTIPVGPNPRGLAVAPDGGRVYVANAGDGTLTVLEGEAQRAVATLSLAGGSPGPPHLHRIALTAEGRRAFLTRPRGNDLMVVDLEALRPLSRILIGALPTGIAITPDDSLIIVTDTGGNKVSFIQASSSAVSTTVFVGSEPRGLVVTPDGRHALVANAGENSLSILELRNRDVTGQIFVGARPGELALSPDGGRGFVTHSGTAVLTVFEPASGRVLTSLALEGELGGLTTSADGTLLFVANSARDEIFALDGEGQHLLGRFPSGGHEPYELARHPSRNRLYVTNRQSQTVTVLE